MRKFLLTIIAMVLWLALVACGALVTYNEVWIEKDDDGYTLWDKFWGEFEDIMDAPFVYFGESDETPGDETPGDETPGDETPGDETPGDETPGDETPGDETPGDETPGGDQNITE